jgi:hypothetical protein
MGIELILIVIPVKEKNKNPLTLYRVKGNNKEGGKL